MIRFCPPLRTSSADADKHARHVYRSVQGGDVVLGLGPWSLVVLKDNLAVLGPVLGLEPPVLGPVLGLEGLVLGPGLGLEG